MIRIIFRINAENFSQIMAKEVIDLDSKGEFLKTSMSLDYPALIRYEEEKLHWHFITQGDEFIDFQGNPYRIGCSWGGVKYSAPENRTCNFRMDYGDGLTIEMRFYEHLLKNWKKMFFDINTLIEVFKGEI